MAEIKLAMIRDKEWKRPLNESTPSEQVNDISYFADPLIPG